MMRGRHLLAIPALIALLAGGCSANATNPSTSSELPSESAPPLSQSRLDDLALQLGIEDPPDVDLVRYVGADYVEVQDECIRAAGFPRGPGGEFSTPPDQTEALHLAIYTCEAQYPIDPKYLEPLTNDQFEKIHEHLTQTAIPCLLALGYQVEPIPSKETYLATVNTPDEYTLSGALLSLGIGQLKTEEAIAQCPELPPIEVLYGS